MNYKTIFITNCLPLQIIIIFSQVSNAKDIYVYTLPHQRGQMATLSISQCSNLPSYVAGKVLSIDTQGQCTTFYDAKNCSGNSVEIMAHSPDHYTLSAWNFQYKTWSVGPCRDPCDSKVTGAAPNKGESVDLTIFTGKNFKGAYKNLKVEGCVPIPRKFIAQLLSVKVYEKCIQFYKNINCESKGFWEDSIELRRGTPRHNDISAWAFPVARSVSHCSFKCNNKTIEEAKKLVELRQNEFPNEVNQVFLYDAINFTGHRHSLMVNQCLDITDDWEGTALSIKTYHNNFCVTLFDKRGCGAEPNATTLKVIGSVINLEINAFGEMARSIEPCGDNPNYASTSLVNGLKGEKEKHSSSFYIFLIIGTITIISVAAGVVAVILRKRRQNGLLSGSTFSL